MMVAVFPVIYIIYRIKKESPGPILFKQNRVGLNGEILHVINLEVCM